MSGTGMCQAGQVKQEGRRRVCRVKHSNFNQTALAARRTVIILLVIKFTPRLDKAINTAAWAHEQVNQHRKGSDLPYIVHPFGTMLIAGEVTDDENVLIACLFHDILEDVTTKNPEVYNEQKMRSEFGDRVTDIVLEVSKDSSIKNWRARGEDYLNHIKNEASDEAVIVSAADKVHNLQAMARDYKEKGEDLWQAFTTKSKADQVWWYESMLNVLEERKAPGKLLSHLRKSLEDLKNYESGA